MSPLIIYIAIAAIAAGFGIGAMIVYSPPRRPCHLCGAKVKASARTCRHCGYRFE